MKQVAHVATDQSSGLATAVNKRIHELEADRRTVTDVKMFSQGVIGWCAFILYDKPVSQADIQNQQVLAHQQAASAVAEAQPPPLPPANPDGTPPPPEPMPGTLAHAQKHHGSAL